MDNENAVADCLYCESLLVGGELVFSVEILRLGRSKNRWFNLIK